MEIQSVLICIIIRKIFKKTEPQNTAQTTQKSETPKCSNIKHGIGIENCNQWFDTKNQAIALYDAEIKKLGDKWTINFYY